MEATERMDHSTVVRTGFKRAAEYFVSTVARVPPDAWERPGLGVWSVRALVGHTSRALLTVESYLDSGAESIGIASAADYYLRAAGQTTGNPAIDERGRQAGIALGDDPARAVRTIADRVSARLDEVADTTLVGTPWGGMALIDYLPTRIFELTIHTMDLIAALELHDSEQAPEEALAVTFMLLGEMARGRHLETDLLLAATGRRGLPAGYTVL
jgi:uncharacterized protein (TIGR03083 family)